MRPGGTCWKSGKVSIDILPLLTIAGSTVHRGIYRQLGEARFGRSRLSIGVGQAAAIELDLSLKRAPLFDTPPSGLRPLASAIFNEASPLTVEFYAVSITPPSLTGGLARAKA
jgi:hypothetical protein